MPTVTLENPDGTTNTIPATVGWERQTEVGKMRRLLVDVERSLVEPLPLERKATRVTLDGVDDVVLVNVEKGGSTWTLVCYSAEWFANQVQPLPGGAVREGSDQSILTDLVNDVGAWTVGNINQYTTGLSFVFNHAERHEAIRDVEANVTGELRFRDYGTVDYVESIGSDKTGSVELSSAAGTIENEIQITERGRQLDGTHIRVLGAHEGEAQIYANLVPESDPQSYPNEVRYQTSRWSDSDDTEWNRTSNKGVSSQSTIESEAAALGEELSEEYVEAKTTVPASVGLEAGDWVRVVKSDSDLDRDMRVHRVTRQAGARNDSESGASVLDKVVLSTRTRLREGDDDDMVVRQQFQSGYQGSSVAVNIGPYKSAIDGDHNITMPFRYPDLAYENTAELQLRGKRYRIDSVGAASGGGVQTTTESGGVDAATTTDNADFSNVVDNDYEQGSVTVDSQTNLSSFSPSIPTSMVFAEVNVRATNDGSDLTAFLDNATSGFTSGTQLLLTEPDSYSGSAVFVDASDCNGETLFLDVNSFGSTDIVYAVRWFAVGPHTHNFDWLHDHQIDIPEHEHDPQPGIYETNNVPGNVDVIVNGTTVATDVGIGLFETEIDLSGEFTRDSWNEIELTSSGLGVLQATVFLEGYDKIGRQ